MRITVAAVGRFAASRAKSQPLKVLFDEYAGRIAWPLDVREVEEKSKRPPAELKKREGELLTKAIPAGAVLVALDERGKALSSEEFASKLGQWRDGGRDVCFAIGGADGLDPAIVKRADLTLSLGRATWPHLLVRVMLAEQIFRAQSILQGHPYHRA